MKKNLQTVAFGIGAVGKDMVYALSAAYVMYFYQDILGLSASFVGLILMIARIFDAINDPFMGILVAKTNSRHGRFRPWLISGTVLNAFVLYALFAVPNLSQTGTMVWFAVVYILWGTTYTMMDIPFWSMIPAMAKDPKERENLSVVGRTCAGVGSAVIQVATLISVQALGGGVEREGFRWVALIVAVLFIAAELFLGKTMQESNEKQEHSASIKEMFTALFRNDQAMITVLTILLINTSLYLTSNLVIYFFKYDVGGTGWAGNYTLFTTVGGGSQILGMMLLYPLLHKKLDNTALFRVAIGMAVIGYALILTACFTGLSSNMLVLCTSGLFVFMANGVLSVLTTVFLSSSVDYGQLKTGRREESVIFSMQTFVVKAASGLAVFITGIGLDMIGLVGNTEEVGEIAVQSAETITGLRLLMTIMPIVGLIIAAFFFIKKFVLTDAVVLENARLLKEKKA